MERVGGFLGQWESMEEFEKTRYFLVADPMYLAELPAKYVTKNFNTAQW